jgi:hypothetical protein
MGSVIGGPISNHWYAAGSSRSSGSKSWKMLLVTQKPAGADEGLPHVYFGEQAALPLGSTKDQPPKYQVNFDESHQDEQLSSAGPPPV